MFTLNFYIKFILGIFININIIRKLFYFKIFIFELLLLLLNLHCSV